MKRIFISHSSKDKDSFVKPMIDQLKKNKISNQNIIYDQLTFEEGKLIDDEIKKWLGEETDLFVLLISDDSLNSDWVQKEIFQSKYLEEEITISKIFPIIIDKKITYDDPRIPEWLRDKYNIKAILSPGAVANKIINKRIEVIYELYPNIKKRHELFVGRNAEIAMLEERFADFEKEQPITVIFSGLLDSGRRSCAKNGFSKLSIARSTYKFLIIRLDQHQSIEDFIFSLSDLGISDINPSIMNMNNLSYTGKIDIAVNLMISIIKSKNILQIIDNGTIVTYDSKVASWFLKLNYNLFEKGYSESCLIVISRFRPNLKTLINTDYYELLFNIPIPLLNKSEINSLFLACCELKKTLTVSRNELAQLATYFNGYPREIINTVDFIEEEGIQAILNNSELINSFSDKSIKKMVDDLLNDPDEHTHQVKDLLVILSMYDFISYNLLTEIIPFNFSNILKKLISSGIVETFGITTEYLSMTTALKNFLTRQDWSPSPSITNKLTIHVKKFLESYTYNAPYEYQDLSDKNFSFKFSLKENLDLGDNLTAIPSYYLKAMKELYDGKNRDEDVVTLADKALISSNYIDPHIINEIRFFLCSALARQKNIRFLEEVNKLSGSVYNFLFGFYYRQLGKYEKAITYLEKSTTERRSYAQAQRELVLCYIRVENYDKAYQLAKNNYENSDSNEFHIQSYFKVTSFAKIPQKEKKEVLLKLLSDIKKIDTDRARNMGAIMESEYELYFNDDPYKAKEIINKATEDFPKDIYIKIFKIELYFRMKDLSALKKLDQSLDKNLSDQNNKFNHDYKKLKAYIYALEGDKEIAIHTINSTNFSLSTKESLITKIKNIDLN